VTRIVPGVVDVVVMHRAGRAWRVLALERAPGARSTGAWEIVHGSIEPDETPVAAARRELREETGLEASRLYTITANPFYLARPDTLQVSIAFAAVVDTTRFVLGPEHSRGRWMTFAAARRVLAWPRTHDLLRQVAWILRTGSAGPVEDVLLVDTSNGE
jgi:8-oxo-dGTP pyrophosphatase MutT (NUDIX family)